jgi:hypothetical protein
MMMNGWMDFGWVSTILLHAGTKALSLFLSASVPIINQIFLSLEVFSRMADYQSEKTQVLAENPCIIRDKCVRLHGTVRNFGPVA